MHVCMVHVHSRHMFTRFSTQGCIDQIWLRLARLEQVGWLGGWVAANGLSNLEI